MKLNLGYLHVPTVNLQPSCTVHEKNRKVQEMMKRVLGGDANTVRWL